MLPTQINAFPHSSRRRNQLSTRQNCCHYLMSIDPLLNDISSHRTSIHSLLTTVSVFTPRIHQADVSIASTLHPTAWATHVRCFSSLRLLLAIRVNVPHLIVYYIDRYTQLRTIFNTVHSIEFERTLAKPAATKTRFVENYES